MKKTKKPIIKIKPRSGNQNKKNVIKGKSLSAATAKAFKKKFKLQRQGGTSVRVSGRDLIYSIPDNLTAPVQNTSVITVIPANPVYWSGTRIAALASGYQNYRPMKFKVSYVPQCAVTQQGNVIGGTIWDTGIDINNIQQTLRTSNGGFLTQCYVPHTSTVKPKSNLQFNLYRVSGKFAQDSNPFYYIAMSVGCYDTNNNRIIPGYFYVSWSFELKNPIGKNATTYNTGLILYQALTPHYNTSIVNCSLTNTLIPFGATLDVEKEEDQIVIKYNGTEVSLEQNTPIWGFMSDTLINSDVTYNLKLPIYYDLQMNLNPNSSINIAKDYAMILKDEENQIAIIAVNTTTSGINLTNTTTNTMTIYLVLPNNNDQDFGVYMGYQSSDLWTTEILTFVAMYEDYEILQRNVLSNTIPTKSIKYIQKRKLLKTKTINILQDKYRQEINVILPEIQRLDNQVLMINTNIKDN